MLISFLFQCIPNNNYSPQCRWSSGGYLPSEPRNHSLIFTLYFHLAARISHFVTAATKFSCCSVRSVVSVVLYGHVITKFSRMSRLLHFLTHGAKLRFARESSAIIQYKFYVLFIGQKLTTWPANNSLHIMVCSCSMLSQNIVICQCLLVDQLFAEAEGWGKQLICRPLTNHDILLNLVQ